MTPEEPPPPPSWLSSDRPLPRLVVRPLREFLDTEEAGGVVLMCATLVALVWANSPWQDSYDQLWHTSFTIRVGDFVVSENLVHWVNDALMTLFFFVVGLEVKRELVDGELADRQRAALPVVAALGGMIVPALLYVAVNAGGAATRGWGIAMATDIAFALGVLALVGRRAPSSLRVFLLSLAIVDDIGAILVIALFYASDIDVAWLLTASALFGVAVLLKTMKVQWVPVYALVGAAVWVATFESGIHATIAGVALGLLAPARPHHPEPGPGPKRSGTATPDEVRMAEQHAQASLSAAERLAHLLHPWTSFVVVPLFALANAGISLGGDDLTDALGSTVTWGIVLGLVVGKLAGITSFAWLACRWGVARLPEDVRWSQMASVAAVAGIGFTVSIFVASLAFDGAALARAKVGILAASVAASALGALLVRQTTGSRGAEERAS